MTCACARPDDEFADLYARTDGFTRGAPRGFALSPTGHRGAFLRSSGPFEQALDLWVIDGLDHQPTERLLVRAADLVDDDGELPDAERVRRERLRESSTGITGFSHDRDLTRIAFALAGQLYVVEAATGSTRRVGSYEGVVDPRLSPDAAAVALVDGADFVVVELGQGEPDVAGDLEVIRVSAESPDISYGLADFVSAEELERLRGHWWSPDSQSLLVQRTDVSGVEVRWLADPTHPEAEPRPNRYPVAGSANPRVGLLHVARPSGSVVEVPLDLAAYEYIADVDWSAAKALVTLASRDQREFVTHALTPADGEAVSAVEVARERDENWLDAATGLPSWAGDALLTGRLTPQARLVLRAGEPVGLEGRHVVAVLDATADSVVALVEREPWQRQVVRAGFSGTIEALSDPDGYATARVAGPYAVVVQHRADTAVVGYRLLRGSTPILEIASNALEPPLRIRPEITTLTDSGLPAAIFWPTGHQPGSHRLPVVLTPYGGPHYARVRAAARSFAEDQWLADQGFVVLVVDNRGTPGRGPAWERSVAGNLAEPVLADQVAALRAFLAAHPADSDPDRVGITGWSFGGFLTALALLAAPSDFRAGWAGAPVTDWGLYDTAYTERYLGRPQDNPGSYRESSLLHRAGELVGELAIVHGLADDNVLAANSLQLSGALLAAGRPHRFLPLAGVSHMTPQVEVKRNLMLLMREHFRAALG